MKKGNVVECFRSIQGEGPNTGKLVIFIRFGGCNLRCEWWGGNKCDTPYASWKTEVNMLTVPEVLERCEELGWVSHFVITGGEPTIQEEFLYELCDALKKEDPACQIDIETNGTRPVPFPVELIVCSPKMIDSYPDARTKEGKLHGVNNDHSKIQENIRKSKSKVALKFVVGKRTDLNHIESFVDDSSVLSSNVYLMPEGITREEVLSNQLSVAEKAMELGYNFSTRLHILLWDKKRGV